MFEVVVNKPENRISNTGINGEEVPTKEVEKRGVKRTHSSSSTPINADKVLTF